ncbi:MAG: hypothetical protein Q9N02_06310 [Ghiorsea sp.]|nr:hypothetical protein [Ghiorsea sp.]
MIDKQMIHQAASLLMREDVQKIILFGSYAIVIHELTFRFDVV